MFVGGQNKDVSIGYYFGRIYTGTGKVWHIVFNWTISQRRGTWQPIKQATRLMRGNFTIPDQLENASTAAGRA